MTTKTYSEKLKDPRWQKLRLSILERDNWTCQYCGDTETELQVHHLRYNGEPWDAKKKDLETVCKHCHKLLYKLQYDKIIDINKINDSPAFVISYILNTDSIDEVHMQIISLIDGEIYNTGFILNYGGIDIVRKVLTKSKKFIKDE